MLRKNKYVVSKTLLCAIKCYCITANNSTLRPTFLPRTHTHTYTHTQPTHPHLQAQPTHTSTHTTYTHSPTPTNASTHTTYTHAFTHTTYTHIYTQPTYPHTPTPTHDSPILHLKGSPILMCEEIELAKQMCRDDGCIIAMILCSIYHYELCYILSYTFINN